MPENVIALHISIPQTTSDSISFIHRALVYILYDIFIFTVGNSLCMFDSHEKGNV